MTDDLEARSYDATADTPADVTAEADDLADADLADADLADADLADADLADADLADADQADPPPLRMIVESVLLVVDQPVSDVTLAQVAERPREEVLRELTALAAEYDAQGRGFALRSVAGGWRLFTRDACAPYVERFVLDGQQARLTQAALETLAVVAYRQPVTRSRVSGVRGVNVDGVMRTLLARGLVEEAGTDEDSGAVLYRTTGYFLERLGLASLDDLPPLAPYLPDVEAMESELDAVTPGHGGHAG